MPKESRRVFTRQFKTQVVSDYLNGKKSSRDISKEHGIPPAMLYRWKGEVEAKGLKSTPISAASSDAHDELRRLREENNRLKIKFAEMMLDRE